MNASQLINQSSLDTMYFTPSFIIEAARATMGSIDLDPASCAEANEIVCAGMYYTEEIDGLAQDWEAATLFMNHPFGKSENACDWICKKDSCKKRGYHLTKRLPGNADWINKLIESHQSGKVEQACCLTFACTSEKWFQPLMAYPQCYLAPRTNFYRKDGTMQKGVTKGSVVTYMGRNQSRFAHHFNNLGRVVAPWHP